MGLLLIGCGWFSLLICVWLLLFILLRLLIYVELLWLLDVFVFGLLLIWGNAVVYWVCYVVDYLVGLMMCFLLVRSFHSIIDLWMCLFWLPCLGVLCLVTAIVGLFLCLLFAYVCFIHGFWCLCVLIVCLGICSFYGFLCLYLVGYFSFACDCPLFCCFDWSWFGLLAWYALVFVYRSLGCVALMVCALYFSCWVVDFAVVLWLID